MKSQFSRVCSDCHITVITGLLGKIKGKSPCWPFMFFTEMEFTVSDHHPAVSGITRYLNPR